MKGEWRKRSLGELTENFDGIRVPVKEADRRPGPHPYYGASGIVDYVEGYLFDGEYLLIAEDGENLRTRTTPIAFLARGKFWVNNHAHVVRGKADEADTRFLMYALWATDISGYLTGSTMPKLTQGNMERIQLATPPLPEQRAIAHILGTLDDKIELNRRMSETLEQMARALFKSWFVDFDPVRWKMERQGAKAQRRKATPNAPASRPPGDLALNPEILTLFPDRLVDSELGPIPEGWEVGSLRDVVEHLRHPVNPLDSPETAFLHFSIPAFDEGQWPTTEPDAAIRSLKWRVPSGTILLSKLNPEIERVWLVDVRAEDEAICSTEFLVLQPRPPFGRSFAYCLARTAEFRRQLESLVTGTSKSHQRAQVDSILGLPVLVPHAELAGAFDRAVAPNLDWALTCRRESRTLATLRDALLPKLISGELRVRDAERFLKTRGLA